MIQLFFVFLSFFCVLGSFAIDLSKKNYGPLYEEDANISLFSGGDDKQCNHMVPTKVYCNNYLCIIIEKKRGDRPLNGKKVLKTLTVLQRYIDLGTQVMNYQPTPLEGFEFTGRDGKKRSWTIHLANYLCAGYGGGAFNGRSWNGLTKDYYKYLYDSIDQNKPVIHQAFLYEMGRSMYDLKLDEILDWQMQKTSEWGYWTLGFNGAMTVLAPETLDLELYYAGMNVAQFRSDRLNDINTYIKNRNWNFFNAWSVWLLPWSPRQSINDMMSGLLILMSDKFGGLDYLSELFRQLKLQPTIPKKDQRALRANNFYVAAMLAAPKTGRSIQEIDAFFRNTLRWTFLPPYRLIRK